MQDYRLEGAVPHMLFATDDYGHEALTNTAFRRIDRHPSSTWYYSSGLSNVVAKEIRSYFATNEAYHRFPFEAIFNKIGARSFVLESDPAGTFAGSSFAYATARDWARLGQLYLQEGSWRGEQILSREYVKFTQRPRPGSGGHYGAR